MVGSHGVGVVIFDQFLRRDLVKLVQLLPCQFRPSSRGVEVGESKVHQLQVLENACHSLHLEDVLCAALRAVFKSMGMCVSKK